MSEPSYPWLTMSRRQETLLLAMTSGRLLADCLSAAGVNRSELDVWLRYNDKFIARYHRDTRRGKAKLLESLGPMRSSYDSQLADLLAPLDSGQLRAFERLASGSTLGDAAQAGNMTSRDLLDQLRKLGPLAKALLPWRRICRVQLLEYLGPSRSRSVETMFFSMRRRQIQSRRRSRDEEDQGFRCGTSAARRGIDLFEEAGRERKNVERKLLARVNRRRESRGLGAIQILPSRSSTRFFTRWLERAQP